MVLTILFAVPGLLILLVLAASPLFQLWDDHASDRAAGAARAPRRAVAIPAPRPPSDAVRTAPAIR